MRRWLLWLLIGPLILLLVVAAFTGTDDERRTYLLTAAIVFLLILPFDLIVARTRLELTSAGPRLRQFGYQLTTDWDNIQGLCLERGREAFVTDRPLDSDGAARLAHFRFAGAHYAPLYDDRQMQLLDERRLIPIEAFAWHLRHGEMRDDIIAFAPHLKGQFAGD